MEKLSSTHIQTKFDLSQDLKELFQKEKSFKIQVMKLQEAVDLQQADSKPKRKVEDITQLITTINSLESEISNNELQNSELESQLTIKKTEHGILSNKLTMLQNEKEQLVITNNQRKAEQTRAKKDSAKVKSERARLDKLRKQIENKEEVKKNLEAATQTVTQIEQVIVTSSPTTDSEKGDISQEISKEVEELIFASKRTFDEAQTKFSSTDLTPYLIDADKAYKLGVKAFILLSERLDDTITSKPFTDQVFEIVNYGLVLNTRHLSAVEGMLQKLEKGVEISPLASFANEVRDYFVENLILLGVTGVILEID